MSGILRAYSRSFHSLFLPGILRHFLWPMGVALATWIGLAVGYGGTVAHALVGLLRRFSFLAERLQTGSAAEHAVRGTLHVSLYLLLIPLILVTTTLLLELVALPLILEKVAKAEYPEVERRRGGSQWRSVRNTLVSLGIAAIIAVPTLPLWFVPGVGILLSVGFSAWLNYRSFRYDVLMNHADTLEIDRLPRLHQGRLILLSTGAAFLTLVPLLNLLAVPFTALAFTHYLLHVLHRDRAGQATLKT